MKIGVSLKIDVKKIEKARLYEGQKGTYLDATVFIDLDQADEYGNHGMITQDVSKDERAQNVKGAILGNVKVFYKDGQQSGQNAPQQPVQNGVQQGYAAQQPSGQFDDDIPFMRLDSFI